MSIYYKLGGLYTFQTLRLCCYLYTKAVQGYAKAVQGYAKAMQGYAESYARLCRKLCKAMQDE